MKQQKELEFHFRLSEQEFEGLKRLAAADDRPMASMLRILIREKAAARGLLSPVAVPHVVNK